MVKHFPSRNAGRWKVKRYILKVRSEKTSVLHQIKTMARLRRLNSGNILEVRFKLNRPAKSEKFGRVEPNFENIELKELRMETGRVDDSGGTILY